MASSHVPNLSLAETCSPSPVEGLSYSTLSTSTTYYRPTLADRLFVAGDFKLQHVQWQPESPSTGLVYLSTTISF